MTASSLGMNAPDEFAAMLKAGDVAAVRAALDANPALANATIRWYENQWNESDPLHFVCDCVGHGWLVNGREGDLVTALIEHGAHVNGTPGREPPIIGAASLGAEKVAAVLIDAAAELERTALFGARALHWAAWTGEAGIVKRLLARGVAIEPRCTEFGATPLFWAVHGNGRDGPSPKKDQLGAARALIEAGAKVDTANKAGITARELARETPLPGMSELLERAAT